MIDADVEARRLLDFARASAQSPVGFCWLDGRGVPDPAEPVHTWVSTRMTHVFALASLQGDPDAAEVAEHGIRALRGPLRDAEHGGWFAAVGSDGTPVDPTKSAYVHAFVVLAASSAVTAGVPGAEPLLADALDVVGGAFLDDTGRVVDQLGRDMTEAEAYRGANSSMHMVEAFLAAGDVTGDRAWHQRALTIAAHLVHEVARGRGYLLPEHFAEDWTPLPDYNADDPADPFRPFGCTPGHLLEWSRLLIQIEGSVPGPPSWLLDDARGLFAAAVGSGWAVDGEPGLVYTVDWQRRPVVRGRMHWVHAEAWASAAVLSRRTGDGDFAAWASRFEDYVARFLIDHEYGSWHHELDEWNRPATTIWHGKPDIYHAYQALLLTRLPTAPSLAAQLAAGAVQGRSEPA